MPLISVLEHIAMDAMITVEAKVISENRAEKSKFCQMPTMTKSGDSFHLQIKG
jgi:hypothetical protein